jgi:hypothetical protein
LKWVAPSSGALTLISTTSFSAVTSQSFDNVFSATYTNYKIFISHLASNTNVMTMRLRASGSDNTTSNYYDAVRETAAATGTAITNDFRSASSIWVIGTNPTSSASQRQLVSMDMMAPFQTTFNKAMTFSYAKATGEFGGEGWGVLAVSGTAFDGFTLANSAGGASTITGTVSIYGWSI